MTSRLRGKRGQRRIIAPRRRRRRPQRPRRPRRRLPGRLAAMREVYADVGKFWLGFYNLSGFRAVSLSRQRALVAAGVGVPVPTPIGAPYPGLAAFGDDTPERRLVDLVSLDHAQVEAVLDDLVADLRQLRGRPAALEPRLRELLAQAAQRPGGGSGWRDPAAPSRFAASPRNRSHMIRSRSYTATSSGDASCGGGKRLAARSRPSVSTSSKLARRPTSQRSAAFFVVRPSAPRSERRSRANTRRDSGQPRGRDRGRLDPRRLSIRVRECLVPNVSRALLARRQGESDSPRGDTPLERCPE